VQDCCQTWTSEDGIHNTGFSDLEMAEMVRMRCRELCSFSSNKVIDSLMRSLFCSFVPNFQGEPEKADNAVAREHRGSRRVCGGAANDLCIAPRLSMIRKLKSGQLRLYSRKKDEATGKRKNLGTFDELEKAKKHEREVQYFKSH
jgi:hypothetical protein